MELSSLSLSTIHVRSFSLLLLSLFLANVSPSQELEKQGTPFLRLHGAATQLVVDGKPILMLGGELGNSSASSVEYMRPMWDKLTAMHLTTVVVPVYWELIEPSEGAYDFSVIDSMILAARARRLKAVLLWFGSWKNSMSCYAPAWLKTDEARFPRARTSDGRAQEILTPFSRTNMETDARSFAAFMKHLRALDGASHTVVLVQVENEIGMIPQARDYCREANEAYRGEVPRELMAYLAKNQDGLTPELREAWKNAGGKSSGSWEEVFGKGTQTDEFFMAWYFALYTNYVAERGKKEYALPMYVNAALIRPGYKPGQYPSAGPLPHLFDIWKAGAPAIDFFAPDIYFKNFAEWLSRFDAPGNGVFIPEVASGQSMANAFYAFAEHHAMGYSPFSIESLRNPADKQVAEAYDVLHQLEPLILEHQGTATIAGVLLDSATQTARVEMGDYVVHFRHEYSWRYAERIGPDTPRVGGMIIQIAPDEFVVAGTGILVTFWPRSADAGTVGYLSIDEGRYVDGKWVAGRRLNGDQNNQGRELHLPLWSFGIQRVKLYTYR